MKYLTNMYDPSKPDAKSQVLCMLWQSVEEAWEKLQRFLQGKIVGRPKETDTYTVEELEAIGLVGIYAPD